ncbi:AfsR family transcriptional regulator [Streptomyces sp. TRM66268-LWL]|uniref:AfsR family transcriptional regulator n=1 Tax=Streptomyces polyasparticus TaxID=2767826 RepID=A0ABR7SCE0_9ACTN|nr:BTAD domain-containing putative transcriptional regulator [Streptomyces polyasparticus]MBC9711998.1 AfsR family transcriptional regulator [Streptomyces polyasparticus]
MIYRYRLLGTTRVLRQDGTEVPLGGPRIRALVAALALAPGRSVPAGQLAAQIRPAHEEPPADEVKALQALVGRLRKAIGPAAVETGPGGYRLAATAEDVDLFRFQRLVSEGTAALDAGDAARAAALSEDALGLWSGEVLLDLPGRESDPAAVRAELQYAQARRTRLAAEVALGRAAGALDELTVLTVRRPLDEPLQALRLRALLAAGRRAEALAAYEEVRRTLVEELGSDPGEELQAVYGELLGAAARGVGAGGRGDGWAGGRRGGGAGEWRDAGASGGREAGERRDAGASGGREAGERRDAGANGGREAGERRDAGANGGREAGERRVSGNLRARLSSFVGRDRELSELADELGKQRLVTLLGPGGVGKTRLSLEAAEAQKEVWPDGVWMAELAPVREGSAVVEAVLTALGARETTLRGPGAAQDLQPASQDPSARLVEHCGRRRMLLILDNCEHVIDAAAQLAEDVLSRCPGVTVLTTSRAPLGVPGEAVRPVEPLPQDVALRLFGERGAAVRPGFRSEDDAEACAEICARLDGLPLALELAAARLRLLTPRQIADRLDDRFRLLTGGARTLLPRQQTLRAVVDWSWELLDEDERAVLRRLAVFAGGCALEQAQEVCGEDGPHTLDVLGALVDKSLVVADPGGRFGMRYRLLETVGEYAAARLDASGERSAYELRHLMAYRELTRSGEPELRGPRQVEWLERFELEHDNVRAALRTAVEAGAEQDGLCLVHAMSWFWQLRGHQADVVAWSTAVAALGPDPFEEPVRPAVPLEERCTDSAPPWEEEQVWEARRGARLLVQAAATEDQAAGEEKPGDEKSGAEKSGERTSGDESTRGGTAGGRTAGGGPGSAGAPHSPGQQAYLRRIVAAYRSGLPQVCRQPGSMWYFARMMTGDLPGLEETMDTVVRDCWELGPEWRANHHWELGFTLLMRAKFVHDRPATLEQATEDAARALRHFERTGDPWGIAEALSARGEAYLRRGLFDRAAEDFARAVDGATEAGAYRQVPLFKARLADVRLRTTEDPRARSAAERMLLEAVGESAHHGDDSLGTARLLLARHYGSTGRLSEARAQLAEVERALPTGVPQLFRGTVEGVHGWLDCLEGRYASAQHHLREAVRGMSGVAYLVAPQLVVDQFLAAAWAKARLGEGEDGARLLGAYDRQALSGGMGFRPFPDQAAMRRHAEAELRAVLEPAAYARAYAEGSELSVEGAAGLV